MLGRQYQAQHIQSTDEDWEDLASLQRPVTDDVVQDSSYSYSSEHNRLGQGQIEIKQKAKPRSNRG